ncbi:MAG: cell envelope protein SmpA, partial [Rhodospirillaceae bacterium]|nr:cell envelope protein SmpA [Rhodospirillaceae bacterium]
LEFDTAGFVKQVVHLPSEDIREIDLVERETPTKGRELGFLQQILGNVGLRAVSDSE